MTKIYVIMRGTHKGPASNDMKYQVRENGHHELKPAQDELVKLLEGGQISADNMMGEDKDGVFHSIIKVDGEPVTVH